MSPMFTVCHEERRRTRFGAAAAVQPALSNEALFRIGGTDRRDPTRSLWLKSGDVLVMGGAARLAWHGIDRLRYRSSRLLPNGGRINLTLRVVAD